MPNSSTLSDHQVDHLFLLIGANPLPNFVAAKLLGHSHTTYHLIASAETVRFADNIKRQLSSGNPVSGTTLELSDPGDPFSILNELTQYLHSQPIPTQATIGLNYTGGTKPMAIHAHEAISRYCSTKNHRYQYSYLDPNRLALRFAKGLQYEIQPVDCPVVLKMLLELHGRAIKPQDEGNSQPILSQVCLSLGKNIKNEEDLRVWRKWYNDNLKRKASLIPSVKPHEFLGLNIDTLGELQAETIETAGWAQNKIRWANQLKSFLDGTWLESYTLYCVQQVAKACSIHDARSGFRTLKHSDPERDSEFDVVALKGYQLFGISCTTSRDRAENKKRLFELFVRARQLGGDEARMALIGGWGDAEGIESEMWEDFLAPRKALRVFGPQDWPHLQKHLQDWFNGIPKKRYAP